MAACRGSWALEPGSLLYRLSLDDAGVIEFGFFSRYGFDGMSPARSLFFDLLILCFFFFGRCKPEAVCWM
ncbi:hypothetical protein VTN49DRAFT_2892 [Thermomyces lanuginosus]|uniref:uncharacterized protein n=1 Tax=Thermomyces lanuginosus TaxID=5541 RepID=UPI00374214A6